MIYRHTPIQDEIHLLLIFAFLTAFFGCFVAVLGVDMSNQKLVSILLAIFGIIFSQIAHYKYRQNPQSYHHNYKTSIVSVVCLVNFGFIIYFLY